MKKVTAAQFAVSKQLPVPLVMVTKALALVGVPVTAPTVQTPVGVIVGMMPAFVVAVTVKLVLYAAVAGAPVKVTVGAIGVVVKDATLDHAEESASVAL